jgi:hypothetical protein
MTETRERTGWGEETQEERLHEVVRTGDHCEVRIAGRGTLRRDEVVAVVAGAVPAPQVAQEA